MAAHVRACAIVAMLSTGVLSVQAPATVRAAALPVDAAVAQLLTFYDWPSGLFKVSSANYPFWTTANAFETLANYLLLTQPAASAAAGSAAAGSAAAAAPPPPLNSSVYVQMLNNTLVKQALAIFTDDYRDDHLWYVLALDRAFAATGEPLYRNVSNIIYTDLLCSWYAWNATCGGMEWAKGNPYLNAITNELFFAASERLALQAGGATANACNATTYAYWSDAEWAWFNATAMYQPATGLFQDGLDEHNCSAVAPGAAFWTYNQGVVLSALALRAARVGAPTNASLLAFAAQIMQSAAAYFGSGTDGVLAELSCGAGGVCSGMDGQQFKGVFMRHLMYATPALLAAEPALRDTLPAFTEAQAASIVANDSSDAGGGRLALGQLWQGPFSAGNPDAAVAQGAALDALLAAYALQAPASAAVLLA